MYICTQPHAPPQTEKQKQHQQKPNKPTRKSKYSFMLFVVEIHFNVFTLQSSKKIH